LPAPTQKLAGPDLLSRETLTAFVIALDAVTGAAKAAFGTGGIQSLWRTLTDEAFWLAANGGTVYVADISAAPMPKSAARDRSSDGREPDAFVLAFGRRHWLGEIGFGFPGSGIQTFGGSGNESGVE